MKGEPKFLKFSVLVLTPLAFVAFGFLASLVFKSNDFEGKNPLEWKGGADCSKASVFDKNCYSLAKKWEEIPWNVDFLMNFINYNKFYHRISYEDYMHKMVVRHFTFYHFKHLDILKRAPEPYPGQVPLVPLKLHRIWITSPEPGKTKGAPFPDKYLSNVSKDFKRLGPGWEYIFWFYKQRIDPESEQKILAVTQRKARFVDIQELKLDEDFLREIESQYQKRIFNCMADSLRLHILAQQGGLYLDTDIELKYNVTKFAFQTKMLVISHPMFLFHHFMLMAPNYKPELILNVTYAHRNNYNAIMSEYYKFADDTKPEIVVLCRHHLWSGLYEHKSERSYNDKSRGMNSNIRLHNHNVYAISKMTFKPYYGLSYEIFEKDLQNLQEQVIIFRSESNEKAKGHQLPIKQ
jgi:hypothetical protein